MFKGLKSPFSLEAKFRGLSPAHGILPHVSVEHSAAVAVLGSELLLWVVLELCYKWLGQQRDAHKCRNIISISALPEMLWLASKGTS